jgi:hypothetical protein
LRSFGSPGPRYAPCCIALGIGLAFPLRVPAECLSPFHVEVIDSVPTGCNYAADPPAISLRVDGERRPCVAYVGPFVHYAQRDASGWTKESVGNFIDCFCTLLLDTSGQPYILIRQGIVSRQATAWTLNPNSDFIPVDFVSGVMDTAGNVHACLLESYSGGRYYGGIDYVDVRGSDWTRWPLEFSDATFHSPYRWAAVALDSRSTPRLCVTNTQVPSIRYWPAPVILPAPETIPHARWGSLAIDSHDISHLAYYDTQTRDLEYAQHAGSTWSITPVDTVGDVGAYASLAIDAAGGMHIAYYDKSHGDLRYASRATGAGPWSRCVVDSLGDAGYGASLALDADGHVHIAYYEAGARQLKYATTRPPVAIAKRSWSDLKARYR